MRSERDYRELLKERLQRPAIRLMDAKTTLRHFALINYAVSAEQLDRLIPCEDFEVARFETNEGTKAFLSVVPFLDVDFNFPQLAPRIRFRFYQTNHRAYIIEKRTRQPAVWFFGTNLGSRLAHLPQRLWKIPWHYSKYTVDCRLDETAHRYEKYS